MTPKAKRLRFVSISLIVMAAASVLILSALRDNLVFFFTPTEWQEKSQGFDRSQTIRIGGLVEEGSIENGSDGTLRFTITDLNDRLPVRYQGFVPNLFREGQGVVAEGVIDADGVMQATTILAKHDENYMPQGVVEQLKKSGRWQP